MTVAGNLSRAEPPRIRLVGINIQDKFSKFFHDEQETDMAQVQVAEPIFINESELQFTDISSERWREYIFAGGGAVRIEQPLKLNVSESRGHRIFDAQGRSHYIPWGWIHLSWEAKEGAPHFVR